MRDSPQPHTLAILLPELLGGHWTAYYIFTGEISHRSELYSTTPHHTVDFAEVVSLLNIPGGSDRALTTSSFPA